MRYLTFDIEIAKVIPESCTDWDSQRPLGISCAAVFSNMWKGPDTWNGTSFNLLPDRGDPRPPKMTPYQCCLLVEYLADKAATHYVVTWNGLGFDFKILAEECQSEIHADICKKIALSHMDIGFQMHCERGFMIGLDAAAKGLGLPGKTEGMHGALAPVLWKRDRASQEKVLHYVAQDVRATMEVLDAIVERKSVPWISRSGRQNYWYPQFNKEGDSWRLLTVEECLCLDEPDVSRMSNPRPRTAFLEWTEG